MSIADQYVLHANPVPDARAQAAPRRESFTVHLIDLLRPDGYWPQPLSIEEAFEAFRWMAATGSSKPEFTSRLEWGSAGINDLLTGGSGIGNRRIEPVSSTREVLRLARWSAQPTHDHPEAVRGAEAVALAIHLARAGWSPPRIREAVTRLSGYDLSGSVDDLRATAEFECKTWISVPRAIVCALRSTCFEDAIRNAVSVGGDADIEAAIAGAIAEPLHGIGEALAAAVVERLPDDLRSDLRHLLRRRVPAAADPGFLATAAPWDPDCVRRWQSRFDVPAAEMPSTEEDPPTSRRNLWKRGIERLLGRRNATREVARVAPPRVLAAQEALRTFERTRRVYGCREMAVREAARSIQGGDTTVEQLAALLALVAEHEAFEGRDPMAVLLPVGVPTSEAARQLVDGLRAFAETDLLDAIEIFGFAKSRFVCAASSDRHELQTV